MAHHRPTNSTCSRTAVSLLSPEWQCWKRRKRSFDGAYDRGHAADRSSRHQTVSIQVYRPRFPIRSTDLLRVEFATSGKSDRFAPAGLGERAPTADGGRSPNLVAVYFSPGVRAKVAPGHGGGGAEEWQLPRVIRRGSRSRSG